MPDNEIIVRHVDIQYGYDSYRLDRNRYGECVLRYVNNQMRRHLLKQQNSLENESIWVKMCLKKAKPIYLCMI